MSTPARPEPLVRQTVAQLAEQAHRRESPAFDPSASPWHERAIFITGAPRSGTSWLHQMLLTHPDVATAGEMHVFCEGLDEVFGNFANPDPYMYLSTWVTRPELLTLARQFVDGVLTATVRATRPGAGRVIDKTPNHAHCARLMAEVYPDATYVQIVRNPRDSLSSARDLWADWNPRLRSWRAAAADWRETVEDCRRHLSGLRYHEVRYEDLLADPPRRLAEILDAAGLPYDAEYVAAAVEFGKAPVNVRPSDQRISADKWQGIDPLAEQDIVSVAGDLMVELGYLDAAERARIIGRRSLRRIARDARSAARAGASRAASGGRRALRRRDVQARRAQVREAVERLLASAAAGNLAEVGAVLAPDVELIAPDGSSTRSVDAVAAALCEHLRAARTVPFSADGSAMAVEVVPVTGARRHHRYFVRAGRVTRVVIEGS